MLCLEPVAVGITVVILGGKFLVDIQWLAGERSVMGWL